MSVCLVRYFNGYSLHLHWQYSFFSFETCLYKLLIEWTSRVPSLSFNRCIDWSKNLKLRANICMAVVWLYKMKQCIFMSSSQLNFKENEIDSSHGLNLYFFNTEYIDSVGSRHSVFLLFFFLNKQTCWNTEEHIR